MIGIYCDEKMTVIGECYVCKRTVHFDPERVPSIPANLTRTGQKEPVCRECIEVANPMRVANGLAPIEVLPDAYV
jgi:hypothetical protein